MDKKDFYVNVRYKYDKEKDKDKEVIKNFKIKNHRASIDIVKVIGILAIGVIINLFLIIFLIRSSYYFLVRDRFGAAVLMCLMLVIYLIWIFLFIYSRKNMRNFYCIEFKKRNNFKSNSIYIMNNLVDKSINIERFDCLDEEIDSRAKNLTLEKTNEVKRFVYEQMRISMKYRNKKYLDKIIFYLLTGACIPIMIHSIEATKYSWVYIIIFIYVGFLYFIGVWDSKKVSENLKKIDEIIEIKILEYSYTEK
ncbi:hypothetical protein [Cetobacterium sp.]|uniref:hypothetical protein n=1 Tax=Cetobacterium sp. TaxID=2071632 RepID=UPI003F36D5D5